ncbi:MAG: rRNA pseudouridine synthase [Anaerolineae bacterium]|nr:rRNA pseudouridine synthase [Anaerolineae bacterium]
MSKERLQKILAYAGYGSRRSCEEIIEQGRVAVDGKLAQLGDKGDPETQRITVDGEPVKIEKRYLYIALHKPRGVISTVNDPYGRRNVRDLIPLNTRLYPIGRLDADSEGLILMTNDGNLTQHLTHPSYGHKRIYRVHIEGEPTPKMLERLQRGISLDGNPARCKSIAVEPGLQDGSTWLRVSVEEGRNHMLRRMMAALGYPVKRLIRVQMGPIQLGDLPRRKWRYLQQNEIEALEKQLDIKLYPAKPDKRPDSYGTSRRRQPGSRSKPATSKPKRPYRRKKT